MSETTLGLLVKELIAENSLPAGPAHGEHYEIISKVAYLLGVSKHIFEDERQSPDLKIYEELQKNKHARIIRCLCHLRTQLEINFLKVCRAIQQDYKTITSVPELIPQEDLEQLFEDGVDLYHNNREPSQFLFELNRQIKNRINNCRSIFPDWLNWEYLMPIFIMPNGTSEEGTKEAAKFYYDNQSFYPYKVYMNWPAEDQGNILYNDKKFVCLLYEWNGDQFTELTNVADVNEDTKDNIYRFIEDSEKTVFIPVIAGHVQG